MPKRERAYSNPEDSSEVGPYPISSSSAGKHRPTAESCAVPGADDAGGRLISPRECAVPGASLVPSDETMSDAQPGPQLKGQRRRWGDRCKLCGEFGHVEDDCIHGSGPKEQKPEVRAPPDYKATPAKAPASTNSTQSYTHGQRCELGPLAGPPSPPVTPPPVASDADMPHLASIPRGSGLEDGLPELQDTSDNMPQRENDAPEPEESSEDESDDNWSYNRWRLDPNKIFNLCRKEQRRNLQLNLQKGSQRHHLSRQR